ncbi:hypothetical protein AgCh_013931 [Apium graveolens]
MNWGRKSNELGEIQRYAGNINTLFPDAGNMCVKFLRSEVDITEGLRKHFIIIHCPECDTYLQPPRTWIKAQLESRELLTFCVKRLKNLNKVRQHVSHRRTFFFLELVILKHEAAVRAIRITQMDQGIDFFFANRSHAVKFVEFLGKVVPVKSRTDKQLISHDTKSNNYNYKHTFSVEICPICREDLICLPPKVSVYLGNIGPLVIYTKVNNNIALLDPFTPRNCFLDSDQYWRSSQFLLRIKALTLPILI